MENITKNSALQVAIGVGAILSVISGLIAIIRYLDEREIARKLANRKST